MAQIRLSNPKISEAKRFVEILNHPDFIYFPPKPKTIKEEADYIRKSRNNRKAGLSYDFSIYKGEQLVGGAGIKIDQHRTYIGEIGYFVDRNHWGRGIATQAVRLMEQYIDHHLYLKRIEIVTMKKNKASIRVAEKCGYKKEGIQRAKILFDGEYLDAYLFSKIRGS